MPRYVERACRYCDAGLIPVGGPREVRIGECPDCGGTGKTFSLLYPKPKGYRGTWPPEGTVVEDRPEKPVQTEHCENQSSPHGGDDIRKGEPYEGRT